MHKFYLLFLILLSCNLGYSYFSLDPNILEYGNLKFNKSLSGSDDVLSDSAVVLNEGDVMIILRFTTDRSHADIAGNGSNVYQRGGLYIYTKNSSEDETLTPVNAMGYSLWTNQYPSRTLLTEYLDGTYIVGPKLVYIAFINNDNSPFYGSNNAINCEMDYAIQRKRTVNPQPVSQ